MTKHAEWLRKQHALPAGVSKRKYDVVVHTDAPQTKAYEDNAEEDLFEPFDIFEDGMLRRGKAITETEQARTPT